jgi:hypothetical protein
MVFSSVILLFMFGLIYMEYAMPPWIWIGLDIATVRRVWSAPLG